MPDTLKKRSKDINTKVKKGDFKEPNVSSHTAGNNSVHAKTASNKNDNLSLQLITLGVFCAVIGVVLFGFPCFHYNDIYAVGKNVKQWLHNVDVYFNIVSDNEYDELEKEQSLREKKIHADNQKPNYINGDIMDEPSVKANQRENTFMEQTDEEVIDKVREELMQEFYEKGNEWKKESVSENEDDHNNVYVEENDDNSSSQISDEETGTFSKRTHDFSRSDTRPVKTITGNYTFGNNTNVTTNSDFEQETSDSDTVESHWAASGPSLLAREVEQSDLSGSEQEIEEIEETDDSVNDSETSNDNDSSMLYSRANITNESDWIIKNQLDEADSDLDDGRYNEALEKYKTLSISNARSCRSKYGIAISLDKKAEILKSNAILNEAIQSYIEALDCADAPDALFKLIGERAINRMRFKGAYGKCVTVHNRLIERFPNEVSLQNDLAVTYLMLNRLKSAKEVLETILLTWPDNGVAQVHYGFVLKMQTNYEEAVKYFTLGLRSNEPGTQDARFYFHFGDALYRLGQVTEAMQVYEEGASKNLFRSKYQRSFYNVDHLTGRPWWTLEQTTYEQFFRTLEQNWKIIRDEGINVLKQRKSLFSEETELLRETGDWRQFEIYHSGVMKPDCDKVPFTCRLVSGFSPAVSCRQGQIKFSLMLPNTHVWPHCGPTNARLRAHLGLVVPTNVTLRVGEEIRQWEEGKILIFDDSFEHEVWHNGTSMRLVLIVDVWHPELTVREKKTLPTI